MIVTTIILVVLFFSLRNNLSENYENVDQLVSKKASININMASSEDIEKILVEYNYVKNDADARFVARTLHNRIVAEGPINSLFDIRKNKYSASIQEVEDSESETYLSLYRQMCEDLEQSDSLFVHSSINENVVIIDPSQGGEIKVNIKEKDTNAGFLKRTLNIDKTPCSNVFVRLNEHSIDAPEGVTIACLRTDNNGEGWFKGLDATKSYSVLPIAVGFKYGNAQGTIHSTLDNSKGEYSFVQTPITIPLLSQSTLRQIKEDNSMIVRTLDDFLKGLSSRFAGVVLFWWCFFLFSLFSNRPSDSLLTSALLGLTGLCCLIMHSLNNPLADLPLGEETIQGIIGGCLLIVALQLFNPIKFYQNKYALHFDGGLQFVSWLCKPFKKKMAPFAQRLKSNNPLIVALNFLSIIVLYIPLKLLSLLPDSWDEKTNKWLKGMGYLIIAIVLTALLITPLGSEVGGMKVNLNLLGLKFQPSEIAKYLFIVFMAAFFCQNANKIIALETIGKAKLFSTKLKNLFALFAGFFVLMVLYVGLQDLGPALVIIFTFVILYSIIKSKDKIDTINTEVKLKDILSSDFVVLCFGVLSFIATILLGEIIGASGLLCLAWFVVWIGVGLSRFKQIHETSILFNLVLTAFIFGSSLKNIPNESISKIGERLEARSAMCTNTWGDLGLSGSEPKATTNSQIADGLWGLATGGWNGQGLSNGECSLIPAFNTDMILESVGTQIGFKGIILVLILYFILFRRALVIGYRSDHPFTFYLCVGIAIVTGVQLAIIALGSTGMIPLTGITVPLLSYGKVSMILNLFAFGLVLAVSSHTMSVPSRVSGVKAYNNSLSLLTLSFAFVMLIIGATFFYYQWIDRNSTLIRPVLAKNATGIVTLKYNPRISALVDKMQIGDIMDRNGVLLATSNKDKLAKYDKEYSRCNITYDHIGKLKRHYPFGEHLFFMVGDYNTKLFFSGKNRGLLAEMQYLDSLRGYDNILKDKYGNKMYVNIPQTDVFVNRFLNEKTLSESTGQTALRNYSALLPYLKAGVNSGRVKDYNNSNESFFSLGKIKPKDITLSVDAILQTKMQNGIKDFVINDKTLNKEKKVRVSTVILDASTGELLTSANYPLPNLDNLAEQSREAYNDKDLLESYTDMDLGLFYPTPPGSTAKVMSALASFMKYGEAGADFTYPVRHSERPTPGASDVENVKAVQNKNRVTMNDAITWSSNIYFIKLVNDNNLYDKLDSIYSNVGILLNGIAPFGLVYHEPSPLWKQEFNNITFGATDFYSQIKNRNRDKSLSGHKAFWLAWGQNPMTATPLAMAKVSTLVANSGVLPEVKFLKDGNPATQFDISGRGIEHLQSYMQNEARVHMIEIRDYNAGGKTGTVVRPLGRRRVNDAWYICFCDKASGNGKIAIAVRIERSHASSSKAKQLVKNVVLKTLDEMGYIEKI